MSKKYDEFSQSLTGTETYITKVVPMLPEQVPYTEEELKLNQELRDRAIISLVTLAVKEGKRISYAEVKAIIDKDYSELEYEQSKQASTQPRL